MDKFSSAQELSNEWSHFRVLPIESKVRKLCMTQCFTLGVKGLMVLVKTMQAMMYYIVNSQADKYARRLC